MLQTTTPKPEKPKDRGVKTHFFTRVTDVTTEGGDDPPIRTIVSQGPFIYDFQDLKPFEEEDKIEAEINISREDESGFEPASKRIDWSKGPYGTLYGRRSTMRPAYYPPKIQENPFRRVPEYGHGVMSSPEYDYEDYDENHVESSTPVYQAVQDAMKIHSKVTGPHNFVSKDRRTLHPRHRQKLKNRPYNRPYSDYNNEPEPYQPEFEPNQSYQDPPTYPSAPAPSFSGAYVPKFNSGAPAPSYSGARPNYLGAPTPSFSGATAPRFNSGASAPGYYPPTSHLDEEVQEKFHEDRRRNLQNFFEEKNTETDPMLGRFRIDESEESDRIIPKNFIRENEEDYHNENENEFNRGHSDPFEFPAQFFARDQNTEGGPNSGFGQDSDWENFFSGHADNVEKDINSLSKQADDHTAPPDDYQQEEEQPQEQQEQSHSYPEYGVIRNVNFI